MNILAISVACVAAMMIFSLSPSAVAAKADTGTTSPVNAKAARKIMKNSNCLSCHAVHHKIVGPSFAAIAKRYKNAGPQVANRLVSHVKHGVNGIWSHIPMPPHPNLSNQQIRTVVEWILSRKPSGQKQASEQKSKKYQYVANGKKVVVGFPVFRSKKQQYVTHDLFRGYELYNSYCFRCHGPDAMGGEYAPDLRHSVSPKGGGINENRFITIAMEGRKAKGMPSWAGFFKQKQIEDIYEYVKARSVGLVPTGRPKTPQG